MTTCSETVSQSLTETNRYEGTISSDLLMKFGQSYAAHVTDFVLVVTTSIRADRMDTNVIIHLKGFSSDKSAGGDLGVGFTGRWGYPYATQHNTYDYGCDGAGLIEDLPKEILAAISVATGFHGLQDLVAVKASMV